MFMINFFSFIHCFAPLTVIASILSDIDSSSILLSRSWVFKASISIVSCFYDLASLRPSYCKRFCSCKAFFFSLNVNGLPEADLYSLTYNILTTSDCIIVGFARWLGIALTVLHLGLIVIAFEVTSKLSALGFDLGLSFFGEGFIQAEFGWLNLDKFR